MHPAIYRKIVLPLVRSLQGKKELVFLKELEKSQFLTREELINLQFMKAKALLEHASRTVPYYGAVMKEAGFDPSRMESLDELAGLPSLTKRIIRENKAELVSRSFSQRDLLPDSTGGSTGEFVWYYHDRIKMDKMAAAAYRCYRWCGLDVGMKIAKLWGSPRDIAAQTKLRRRIAAFVKNELFLPCYELTDGKIREYLGILREFRPDVIEGYTSVLFLLASYITTKGVQLPRPGAMIATAECVSQDERDTIEDVFGAPVFNKYGSRELGFIAMECREHNGLHMNMERHLVECMVDGRPGREDEIGEIVVTDMDGFAMPFIRYRTGDLGTITRRHCACGRELLMIENLCGRTVDLVVTQEGKLLPGLFLATVFRHSGVVERFQVHQTKNGTLNVKLLPNRNFGPDSERMLESSLRAYVGDSMQISFELVDEILPAPSGKLKLVTSDMKPDFTAGKLTTGKRSGGR
ncbi:MAG: hypothetical protein QME66_09715 [Candidatus Eisenbacteria bacterium]|nr:hypothetical protein [Candidatus Eisenbacteria bacterium]